jgi:hypothetical protein
MAANKNYVLAYTGHTGVAYWQQWPESRMAIMQKQNLVVC